MVFPPPRPNGFTMGESDNANSLADYLPSEWAGHVGPVLGPKTMQYWIAQKSRF